MSKVKKEEKDGNSDNEEASDEDLIKWKYFEHKGVTFPTFY